MTTRRDFIGTGVGAFALASTSTLFGETAASNCVRVAMMGCNNEGRGIWVMRAALQCPGVVVTAVIDVDSRVLEFAKKDAEAKNPRHEAVRAFVDIRKALEWGQFDALLIATPDHWHAWAAVAAMKAGKAVYVEKPCSFCPAEGEIVVRTQAETGMVFQMGAQRRSSTITPKAIQAIRDGAIGEPRWAKCWYLTDREPIGKGRKIAVPEWLDWDLWQGPAPRTDYQDNIVHYNWHWFRRWGTGESGNNATHFLDLARWALDVTYPERTVSAGGRLFYEGDDWEWYDSQNMSFEFPGRKLVTWEGHSEHDIKSTEYMGYWTGCMVHGLKGAMFLNPVDGAVQYDLDGKVVQKWDWQENLEEQKVDGSDTKNPSRHLLLQHMDNFIACVREHNVKTNAPAAVGHASTLMTELANMAQITGETIRTDPKTGRLVKGSAGANLWAREYEKGWELV